jgi:hypothetical protein
MSPIISAHAAKYGTDVIARLEDVPAKIESALAASHSQLPVNGI